MHGVCVYVCMYAYVYVRESAHKGVSITDRLCLKKPVRAEKHPAQNMAQYAGANC